ncbi:signal peptidase I [Vibrio rotiferianus]
MIGIAGDEMGLSGCGIFLNSKKLHPTQALLDSSNEIEIEQLGSNTHLIQYSSNGQLPNFDDSFIVPESKYFVLGDHRSNSVDSRYWGFVESHKIMGKVTHVAFSIASERSSERFAIAVE